MRMSLIGSNSADFLQLLLIERGESADQVLASFVSKFLEFSLETFGAQGASVFLLNSITRDFVLAGQSGPLATIPLGAVLKPGDGPAGLAIESLKPTLLQGQVASAKKKGAIASSMVLPLVERGSRCIGVVNLSRAVGQPAFGASDLEAAESIGRQLALAVSNATLLHETHHLSDMLKVVLSNIGFGFISMDEHGSITHYNPEAVMILGKVPGRGEAISSYVFRCPAEFVEPLHQAAKRGLEGERYRVRVQAAKRVVALSATPLPSKGLTLSIQDVTDLENAQREHDRLRRMAEVGQMTATIAHEIRNPLTGIRSAAKMIQDSPEIAQEFAEIIEVESIKLSRLCDEFLEFARPLRLDFDQGFLHPLAEHVSKTMRHQFDEAGVTLELEQISRENPLQLDAGRIEQVIRNLMLNALQATAEGGKVVVRVGGNLLEVSDTGCGMDAEQVGRLFSPFFTTKPKGTGLGLSMVRKIIDAHEAEILVRSEKGRGTTISVRFNQGERS